MWRCKLLYLFSPRRVFAAASCLQFYMFGGSSGCFMYKSVLCLSILSGMESLDSVNLAKSWYKIKRFCDLSQSKGVKLMFLCVFYAFSVFLPIWLTHLKRICWKMKSQMMSDTFWLQGTGTKPESKRACEMAKLKIAHVNIVWLTYLIHYTKLHILDTHKSWYILHSPIASISYTIYEKRQFSLSWATQHAQPCSDTAKLPTVRVADHQGRET